MTIFLFEIKKYILLNRLYIIKLNKDEYFTQTQK